MNAKILVTTTSFLDTPGEHHQRLIDAGLEVITERGPLSEEKMLEIIGDGDIFDAFLCGDDAFTEAVLSKIKNKAKVISKYGIGLEKIDLEAAEKHGVPVTFTPGVNHTTVSELAFGLLICFVRQIIQQNERVHAAQWKRSVGNELAGKTIGIIGFGRVGKEITKRAMAFGMKVLVADSFWHEQNQQTLDEFSEAFKHPIFSEFPPEISHVEDAEDLLHQCDIVSLNMTLTPQTAEFINQERIAKLKDGAIVLNTSRGALVNQEAIVAAVKSKKLAGYLADVVEPEPVKADNPLLNVENVLLTPHVGSRTYESVGRQAGAAVTNLLAVLNGEEPLAWARKR